MLKSLGKAIEKGGKKLSAVEARGDVRDDKRAAEAIENNATAKRTALGAAAKIAAITARAQETQAKLAPHLANAAFAVSVDYMRQATDAIATMQQALAAITANFQIIHEAPGEIAELAKNPEANIKDRAASKLREAQAAEVQFNAACARFNEQHILADRTLTSANVAVDMTIGQQAEVAAQAVERQRLAEQQALLAQQLAAVQALAHQLEAARLAAAPPAALAVAPLAEALALAGPAAGDAHANAPAEDHVEHAVDEHRADHADVEHAAVPPRDVHAVPGPALVPGFAALQNVVHPLQAPANQAGQAAGYGTDEEDGFEHVSDDEHDATKNEKGSPRYNRPPVF